MNTKTVKGKILMMVLPIVIIGLGALSGIIFVYMSGVFEEQIIRSNMNNTKEVGEVVSAWLDKRMMETHMTASTPFAKNLDSAALNQNNIYRLKLMQSRYPGVYDSVS